MARLLANVHSYHSAVTFLGNRAERKLAHNTYVYRIDDESVGVTLHNTRIVTYYLDGRVQLNSGGWSTSTTKDRINKLLPDGYSLWQHKFDWFVQHRSWPFAVEFKDNMVINASGEPPSHPHAINPMGPYKSFRQCVRSVSHRKRKPRDSRAYCGAIKARTERRNPAIDPATLGDIVWHMSMDGVDEEDSEENIGWMGLMRHIMHHEVLDAAEDAGHSKREARQALREVPDPFHAVLTEDSQGFRDVYPYTELEEAEEHFDTADEWFGREEYEEDED